MQRTNLNPGNLMSLIVLLEHHSKFTYVWRVRGGLRNSRGGKRVDLKIPASHLPWEPGEPTLGSGSSSCRPMAQICANLQITLSPCHVMRASSSSGFWEEERLKSSPLSFKVRRQWHTAVCSATGQRYEI